MEEFIVTVDGPAAVSYTHLDVYKRQVLGGVTIGDGAVIGAGSVVTKDIPAGYLAVGVPCRPLRPITEADSKMELL